jgi:hypothetical protein
LWSCVLCGSGVEGIVHDQVSLEIDCDLRLSAATYDANRRRVDGWCGRQNRLRFLYTQHNLHNFRRRKIAKIFSVGVIWEHIQGKVTPSFERLEDFGLFGCNFQCEFESIGRSSVLVRKQHSTCVGAVLERDHSDATQQSVCASDFGGFGHISLTAAKEHIDPGIGSNETADATDQGHTDSQSTHAVCEQFSGGWAGTFEVHAVKDEGSTGFDNLLQNSAVKVFTAVEDILSFGKLQQFFVGHWLHEVIGWLDLTSRLKISDSHRDLHLWWRGGFFNELRLVENTKCHAHEAADDREDDEKQQRCSAPRRSS